MTLYATTESHIFLQLFLYRIMPQRFPIFHYLSAYLYLLTRIGTMILFFICYIEWCVNYGDFIVSNNAFDIGWCYALWFWVSPIANLLLNFAQYSSVKALFYVSTKVYKHERLWIQLSHHRRIRELYDIYISYDNLSNDDEWSVTELSDFIKDACCMQDIAFARNAQITQFMYDALMYLQRNVIFGKKSNKKKKKKKGIVWKTILYLFQTELTYLSENISTQSIIRAKLRLLNYGAQQAFATRRNSKDYFFDDETNETMHVSLASQAITKNSMERLVIKFAKDIEMLTRNAIANIVNISMKHKHSEAALELLNKLENDISTAKFEQKYNPKHWCLILLRCVICRYGCKTETMIENAPDIAKKKSLYQKISLRFRKRKSVIHNYAAANRNDREMDDEKSGETESIPNIAMNNNNNNNNSNNNNLKQNKSRRIRVSDTSPMMPDVTDAKMQEMLDRQPLKLKISNAVNIQSIEEDEVSQDTQIVKLKGGSHSLDEKNVNDNGSINNMINDINNNELDEIEMKQMLSKDGIDSTGSGDSNQILADKDEKDTKAVSNANVIKQNSLTAGSEIGPGESKSLQLEVTGTASPRMLSLESPMKEASASIAPSRGSSEAQTFIDAAQRKKYFARLNTVNINRFTPSNSRPNSIDPPNSVPARDALANQSSRL